MMHPLFHRNAGIEQLTQIVRENKKRKMASSHNMRTRFMTVTPVNNVIGTVASEPFESSPTEAAFDSVEEPASATRRTQSPIAARKVARIDDISSVAEHKQSRVAVTNSSPPEVTYASDDKNKTTLVEAPARTGDSVRMTSAATHSQSRVEVPALNSIEKIILPSSAAPHTTPTVAVSNVPSINDNFISFGGTKKMASLVAALETALADDMMQPSSVATHTKCVATFSKSRVATPSKSRVAAPKLAPGYHFFDNTPQKDDYHCFFPLMDEEIEHMFHNYTTPISDKMSHGTKKLPASAETPVLFRVEHRSIFASPIECHTHQDSSMGRAVEASSGATPFIPIQYGDNTLNPPNQDFSPCSPLSCFRYEPLTPSVLAFFSDHVLDDIAEDAPRTYF
jgi:hypothetical protein